MQPLPTSEEMAAADAAAISAGTPASVLMERAGRSVARLAIEMMGGRYGRRVVIVCGAGNNGGDGFVAARVLANEGVGVHVLLVNGAPEEGAALVHFECLSQSVSQTPFADRHLAGADLIVDAIFGTGLSRAPEGIAKAAIDAINASGAPVLSVDIPSGVDGNTGAVPGVAVNADVTLAIQSPKLGTASGPGSALAGGSKTADIGIEISHANVHLVEERDVRAALPTRAADAHKGSTGAAAIMAGSRSMGGAAVLACRGAARTGAGYVRLGSVTPVKEAASQRLPEVLTTDLGEEWTAQAAETFRHQIERSDALAIGPGMGTGPGEKAAVLWALASCNHPVLVDADGLNNIVDGSGVLHRAAPTVITPHPGEMGRLLGIEIEDVQSDRVATARRAASELGCIVLLKGPRSVIADPDGKAVINPAGSPALATAGSGDVLTGIIAALLAAGVDAFEATWAGAFLHGRAGELTGRMTPDGVLAWDIAEAVPAARAGILSGTTTLSG